MAGRKPVRVTLCLNGRNDLMGRRMLVSQHESFEDFMFNVQQRLNFTKDITVYSSTGTQITDVAQLQNEDVLYVSSGEPFVAPTGPQKEVVIQVDEKKEKETQDQNEKLHKTLTISSVIAFYFITSIVQVLLNKFILSGTGSISALPVPTFVVWYQMVIALILIIIMGLFGNCVEMLSIFPQFEFDFGRAKQILPLTFFFVAMIVTNNFCLMHVEVSFYQVARSLTILFNIALTYIILGSTTSKKAIYCCLVVVAGFCIGSAYEVNFSWSGIIYGIISSIFVALYGVYTKKVLAVVGDNAMKLMTYNTVLAIFLLIPVIVATGEHEVVLNSTELYQSRWWFSMTITGIVGYCLNIASYLQIKHTSPLTHNLVGTLKATVQTILGVWIWENEITPLNALGIMLVVVGSFAYGNVRYQEMKDKSSKS